ncbi:MAG: hypothetical protein ABIJ97_01510 [Bacteroidota bacterium]
MTKLLFVLIFLVFTKLSYSQESTYKITERNIPEQYKDIYDLLETLKCDSNNLRGYEKENELKAFIRCLSEEGVFFIDPNDEFNKIVSTEQIESELKAKEGKTYDLISHLTSIYSIPYKQYSELKFSETTQNEIVVNIGYMFELIFEAYENKHFLKSCEYLKLEVD